MKIYNKVKIVEQLFCQMNVEVKIDTNKPKLILIKFERIILLDTSQANNFSKRFILSGNVYIISPINTNILFFELVFKGVKLPKFN